jgi:hypothetical protein
VENASRSPEYHHLLTYYCRRYGQAGGSDLQATPATNKQNSQRELAAFPLSMEKLRQAAQTSKILATLSETDPSLKTAIGFLEQKASQFLDEAVSRIDEHARARTAIESTGLSTKRYVLTMYCLELSTRALFLNADAGEKHHLPGASSENLAFVKNHLPEINRLFSESP